jgi:TrmH family RNA methyltransferase
VITSSQNPRIQQVRALLAQRKEREESGLFAVEGVRLVEEAVSSGWVARLVLYTADLSPRGLTLVAACRERGLDVEEVAPQVFKSITDTENPQGILAVLTRRDLPLPAPLHFVVVADQVRDPGNLGTLLRSSAAAGAQAVLLSPGCADAFAPKVMRAGMGAHFRLPLLTFEWGAVPPLLGSCKVYTAESAAGTACWELDLTGPVALVIGGEADGVSQQARALADGAVTIPMPGKSESLNAAVAAGILLFEVVRQRSQLSAFSSQLSAGQDSPVI